MASITLNSDDWDAAVLGALADAAPRLALPELLCAWAADSYADRTRVRAAEEASPEEVLP